jgi:hypothetical protein
MARLLLQAGRGRMTVAEVKRLASRMSRDQWRTVAFQANVAVPDLAAKRLTMEYLYKVAI